MVGVGAGSRAAGPKVLAAGHWPLEFILMLRPQLPQQRPSSSPANTQGQQTAVSSQQPAASSQQPADRCGACGKTIYAIADRNRLNSSCHRHRRRRRRRRIRWVFGLNVNCTYDNEGGILNAVRPFATWTGTTKDNQSPLYTDTYTRSLPNPIGIFN